MPTTGRRDIRSLMEIGEGGIYVQRTGPVVELNLYGIAIPGAATSNLINLFSSNFPQGFRPVASFTYPLITTSSSLEPFPIRIFMNGAGRCSVTDSGHTLFGLVHYLTRDSWPNSLPGDPA